MRPLVLLAAAALMVSSCGGSHRSVISAASHAPAIAGADCQIPGLARAPLPGESGVYRAGPVTLSVGEDLAQFSSRQLARPRGSEAIALVSGDRPVQLRVDPGSRAMMSLRFTSGFGLAHPNVVMSDGAPTVRFPVCGNANHRFGGDVLFMGHGCVRLGVTASGDPPSTMLIPIGNSLRGCPATDALAPLPSSALPFLGISCRTPNSIRCDRIGVGVRLDRHAVLVVVQVAGRLVTPSPPSRGDDLWPGYLLGAGPEHGPLRVRPATRDGLWFGSPEMTPRARVTAFFADGSAASTAATVLLHPGFG